MDPVVDKAIMQLRDYANIMDDIASDLDVLFLHDASVKASDLSDRATRLADYLAGFSLSRVGSPRGHLE